ncbi:MAG: hypothetical protein ABSE51_01530 [Terracidiphilus sp.]|jgi:hypothetical protein
MSKTFQVARLLLGLIFVVFGLNGFYTFIPIPSLHPFMQILVSSGYIYFIKLVELAGGILLLVNRAVVLALVLLGADIANIIAYHLLLDHRIWFVAPVLAVLYAITFLGNWPQLKLIFRWRA